MATVKLTMWERLTLLGVVNVQQGDLRRLRRLLNLVGVLEPAAADRERVGYEEVNGQIRWRDTEHEFELEFAEVDFEVLRQVVTGYKGWQAGQGALVLRMLDKLGIMGGE